MYNFKEFQSITEKVEKQKQKIKFLENLIQLKNNSLIIIIILLYICGFYFLSGTNLNFIFFLIFSYCGLIFSCISISSFYLIMNTIYFYKSPDYYKTHFFSLFIKTKNKLKKEEKILTELESKQFKQLHSIHLNDIEKNKDVFLNGCKNINSNIKLRLLALKTLNEIDKLEKSTNQISNYDIQKHKNLKDKIEFILFSRVFWLLFIVISLYFFVFNDSYYIPLLLSVLLAHIIFFVSIYVCLYQPIKKELNINSKKKDIVKELKRIETNITLGDIKSILVKGNYNDIRFILPFYKKLKTSILGNNEIEQLLFENKLSNKETKLNKANKTIEFK